MTTVNKFWVITQKNYPLLDTIKQTGLSYSFINELPDPTKIKEYIIIDATILNDKNKIKLWKVYNDFIIFSDLSINWGDLLISKFTNVKVALPLGVWSIKNKREVFIKENKYQAKITEFLLLLGLTPHFVNQAGICFEYPRVISMIINEAYFVLDSKIANKDAIETSMKYGVNYPLGPLEWCEKIGPKIIIKILNKLEKVYKTERYARALSLLDFQIRKKL